MFIVLFLPKERTSLMLNMCFPAHLCMDCILQIAHVPFRKYLNINNIFMFVKFYLFIIIFLFYEMMHQKRW